MERTGNAMDAAWLLEAVGGKRVSGPASVEVTALTDDSRRVSAGGLFVARGPWGEVSAGYVQAAVGAGAAAVLLPTGASAGVDLPGGVAVYELPQVDQAVAGAIADRFYDTPGAKLRLVGITGTNGKTTTAMLARHLLAASGVKAGILGTIWTDTGSAAGPRPSELTTPGAIELHALLAEMVRHGCTAAVMEVSSHALEQGRVAGLTFDAAVFTNLTQDHLDYHGTMAKYAAAKATLFTMLGSQGWAVIHADDDAGQRMAAAVSSGRVLWTTLRSSRDDSAEPCCAVTSVEMTAAHSRARFDGPWGSLEATVPMVGGHNLGNALQAAAVTHTLVQQTARDLRDRLEHCPPVPGRLEPVRRAGDAGPTVLVDYAHTPDAIRNAVAAVRPVTAGRLIVVYGCGGDRDRTKRPKMTAAALRDTDLAVLTSDNPRSEDPQRILDDALAEIPPEDRGALTVQIDRAAAIRAAVTEAAVGDTVLITGKGHEDYQVVADPPGTFGGKTRKTHFDDREHAATALEAWTPPPEAPKAPATRETPETC